MELSIVIPVFNVFNYLETCLESVYKISGINFEVIIVNDGSTDKSPEVINYYCNKYKDITTVINQKNRGLSGARNAGIKVAKGKYISFIDSDDLIDPVKYQILFESGYTEDLDIIMGDLQYYNNQEIVISKDSISRSKKLAHLGVNNGIDFWDNCLSEVNDTIRVEVVTNFYKRSLMETNVLLFKEGLLHEDTLFMYLAMFYAKKVKYFPFFFYYYRTREGSIMRNINKKNYLHKLYIANELNDFKKKNGINYRSWDTIIISLYFGALRSYKIMNMQLYSDIKKMKNLTYRGRIKKNLIPILQVFSKETKIEIT